MTRASQSNVPTKRWIVMFLGGLNALAAAPAFSGPPPEEKSPNWEAYEHAYRISVRSQTSASGQIEVLPSGVGKFSVWHHGRNGYSARGEIREGGLHEMDRAAQALLQKGAPSYPIYADDPRAFMQQSAEAGVTFDVSDPSSPKLTQARKTSEGGWRLETTNLREKYPHGVFLEKGKEGQHPTITAAFPGKYSAEEKPQPLLIEPREQ